METNYWNVSSSNETGQEALLGSGFAAFGIIASMVVAVIIIIDAFIVIMLLLSTSVAVPVRVLLTNILVANIILAMISICVLLYSVTLSQADGIQPSESFCYFCLYVFRGCRRQPLYCFQIDVFIWLHVTDIYIYLIIMELGRFFVRTNLGNRA